jgi:hypothetical protein
MAIEQGRLHAGFEGIDELGIRRIELFGRGREADIIGARSIAAIIGGVEQGRRRRLEIDADAVGRLGPALAVVDRERPDQAEASLVPERLLVAGQPDARDQVKR